jgi:phage antirepressor YoqD-like protein
MSTSNSNLSSLETQVIHRKQAPIINTQIVEESNEDLLNYEQQSYSTSSGSSSRTNELRQSSDKENEFDPLLKIPDELLNVPTKCAEQVEQFAKYVWDNGWRAMPHHALPNWLRDNDFLLKGHRPPLPSAKECFKSMFRIHTETGNIWTHLIGALAFIGIAIYFLTRPSIEIQIQEKLIFGTFFTGAIICLVCSTLFHIFYCYSPKVSKLFNK